MKTSYCLLGSGTVSGGKKGAEECKCKEHQMPGLDSVGCGRFERVKHSRELWVLQGCLPFIFLWNHLIPPFMVNKMDGWLSPARCCILTTITCNCKNIGTLTTSDCMQLPFVQQFLAWLLWFFDHRLSSGSMLTGPPMARILDGSSETAWNYLHVWPVLYPRISHFRGRCWPYTSHLYLYLCNGYRRGLNVYCSIVKGSYIFLKENAMQRLHWELVKGSFTGSDS